MSWDCNLHCLAVLTCRVPTCTSTLLHFPAPGCSSRCPQGGFCPSPIPPLPQGRLPLPSPLVWSRGCAEGCGCIPSRRKGGILWLLHSAPPGRSGSWEAPGAHLVCSKGMEGKSLGCFEQNSRGTWMPFGVRLFQLGLGCGRCWSSALAVGLGSRGEP